MNINKLDVFLGVAICCGLVGTYKLGQNDGRREMLEELHAEKIATVNVEKLNEKRAKEAKRKGLFRELLKTAIDNS